MSYEVMLPAACMPKFTSAMEANQLCPDCQKELEATMELQEHEDEKQAAVEERKQEIKRAIAEKREHLKQLLVEVQHARESLAELVEKKQALSVACSNVLTTRNSLQLTRLAYDQRKRSLRQELEELREVEKRNKRREERLKHVRLKNFSKKEDEARADCLFVRNQANRLITELEMVRRTFIADAHRCIFPIEVEALSERDAGEEDYLQMSQINCEESMEVDEGWILSGVHTHPTPNMTIVTASIPSNGDYSTYIKAAAKRRKMYSEAAQQGGGSSVMEVSVVSSSSLHPSDNPYLRIPAALGYIAHLVVIISRVLDQPLPYPFQRHLAISEYSNPNQKKRIFLNSVARLDDNIMYLCFSQNVPSSALTPGHTLQNLLALVTHTHLGRSGAFECYPELTRYRIRSGKPLPLSHDPDDSEPPNVLYPADQSTHSYHGNRSDSDSDEEESDDPTEEETLTNYHTDSDILEWECLDPSAIDLQLFQEEQLKLRSAAPSLGSGGTLSQADIELARDRARRLDYNSTYLDYVKRSLNESSSVQLSAKDSIRLLSSIDEDKRGVGPQAVTPTVDGETPIATATGGGLFGTLSGLWTSTFGGSNN